MLTVALSVFFGASALWVLAVTWDSIVHSVHAARSIQAELKLIGAQIAQERALHNEKGRPACRQPSLSFHRINKRQSPLAGQPATTFSGFTARRKLRPLSA